MCVKELRGSRNGRGKDGITEFRTWWSVWLVNEQRRSAILKDRAKVGEK